MSLVVEVLHIGIVSDGSVDGRLLIIHNIGRGTREEDVLLQFNLIIGHHRLSAEDLPN